jgi:ectoine hydroxylase-related dioxygenase (phytanoyl-CoA dioxygenase family)
VITEIATDKALSDLLKEQVTTTASSFLAKPNLTQLVSSKTTLALCKELPSHDRLVLYPNLTVRANAATDWHIDAAFTGELAGLQPHPDFLQCAVYLQDNPPGEGGGIDVVPRSHVRLQADGSEYAPAASLNIEVQARRVESSAGDLVVWDARLLHRSSLRIGPAARDKLAIHWTVSRSTLGAVQFLEHLVRRGVARNGMNPNLIERYQDIAAIRYPDHLPAEACSALQASDVFFATLAWATAVTNDQQAERAVA